MNVLKSSFGRSLAAAVVAAVVSPFSADAVADGPPKPDEALRREGDRPREVERADRDVPRGEGAEAQALRRQIEVMRLAMPALKEGEKRDAAELLERAMHARQVTLEGRRDDEARQIRERAPARGQLAEILMMAAKLWAEFDNEDKAEAVERLAKELAAPQDRPVEARRGEMDQREPREREEIAGRLIREREGLKETAARIQRELGELRDGQEGEAKELKGRLARIFAEARQIDVKLRGLGEAREGPRDRPRPEMREEMERRMMHLRAAAENLHAAGLHEQAQRLMQEAERTLRGAGERMGDRPEGPRPPEQRDRPPEQRDRPPEQRDRPPEHIGQMQVGIHELRAELERMREQMAQMRRQMELMLRDRDQDELDDKEEDDDR